MQFRQEGPREEGASPADVLGAKAEPLPRPRPSVLIWVVAL